MSSWQTISTAPRGVSVLCYWPAVKRGDVTHEAYIGQAWQRFGNWFKTRDGYGSATSEVNEPTHWMPLPKGPTLREQPDCGCGAYPLCACGRTAQETGRDDDTCTTCKGTGWDSELEKRCDCV